MKDNKFDEDRLMKIFEEMLNASEELERVEEERLNLLKSTNSIEREIHNIELDVKLKVYFSKEYKNENQRKIMCDITFLPIH